MSAHSAEDLREMFSKYGDVRDCYIPRDHYTNQSRGFGFIRFATEEEAQDAIDGCDRRVLDGRELRVQVAQHSRPPLPDRGGARFDRRDDPRGTCAASLATAHALLLRCSVGVLECWSLGMAACSCCSSCSRGSAWHQLAAALLLKRVEESSEATLSLFLFWTAMVMASRAAVEPDSWRILTGADPTDACAT
eukprot:4605224-Pleurochrysis_carterae.AAC.4